MTDRIKLTFERGGQVTVTLLKEAAPETCRVVLDALPAEGELIHAITSGEEVFASGFPAKEDVAQENSTIDVKPGDIAYYDPAKSFCIFYGVGLPRSGIDETSPVNVFGKADDIEKMAEIGKRIRRQGVEKVQIEVA